MAGTIKTHVQLGDSTTATNNFLISSQSADGTMKIARGNDGATTQDILTVNASGVVTLPNNIIPAFSAYQSTAQSLAQAVFTKLQFQSKEFDTANAFDAVTNFRFTPLVSGYYQVSGAFQVVTAQTICQLYIYKNGAAFKIGVNGQAGGGNVSALVFLNGITDYVELFGYQSAAAQNTNASISQTYFQAILIRAA